MSDAPSRPYPVTSEPPTQEFVLRAMAANYAVGNGWDHLDQETCIKAADEIKALRTGDAYRAAWLDLIELCNRLKEENFQLRHAPQPVTVAQGVQDANRMRRAILGYLDVHDACGGSESVNAERFSDARHALREAVAEVPEAAQGKMQYGCPYIEGDECLLEKHSFGPCLCANPVAQGSPGCGVWRPIETVLARSNDEPMLLYFPPTVAGSYKQSTQPAMYRTGHPDDFPFRKPSHYMLVGSPSSEAT